jgi:ABC-type glycerol-3-phosphate transport system substrate-binding protein
LRRAAVAAVLVAATTGVAACGSSGDGGGSDAKATPEQKSTGGKVTLNAIFLPATWGTIVKDTFAPEYEKETGVKVNVQLIARDAIHDKMATLFAAKDSSFDIFNLDYNWIPEFGGAGNLEPMDDVITADDRADFLPLAMKVATWNNKLYGVPQEVSPQLLWYRKDLYGDPKIQQQYEQATGQKLEAPKTMDEWAKQVQFFHGKTFHGKKTYGWTAQAAKGFGNVHTWLTFLYTYGGAPLNADFTKSTLSTPQAKQATKQWADMQKFMPPGSTSTTYDAVTTNAQQGTVATALQWSWSAFATDDTKNSRTVGKWAYTQVPSATAGQPSKPHLGEWIISVSKYSKNAAEAKKFVAWLETKKNDVKQAALGGGDPVRASSYSDTTLTDAKVAGTSAKRFRRFPEVTVAMKNAMPRPFFPNEERWEKMVTTPLQAIALGQTSLDQGLADADKAVDGSLQR